MKTIGLPFDDERTRGEIVAAAEALVGMKQADELYQTLLYPYDEPAEAKRMALSQSGCALACMAILRVCGCRDARLLRPYAEQVGQAVAIVVGIARSRGAWMDAQRWTADRVFPGPGDMVLIGGTGDYGGPEHVFTITDISADGLIGSVDAGQPDIAKRVRRLVPHGTQLWARRTNRTGGRRLQGWLSCTKLGLPDEQPDDNETLSE